MSDIRKRIGKKGVSWQLRYTEPSSGKVRYKSFARKKEADHFLLGINNSDFVHDSDTVSLIQAVNRWLDVCENIGRKGREPVEPSTLRKYKLHGEIITKLAGSLKLNKLTPYKCSEIAETLLQSYSRPYAKKILTSFKSVLSQARSDGAMKHDPAENVAIVTSTRYEKAKRDPIPSLSEVGALLSKAAELAASSNQTTRKSWLRYYPMIMLLIYSGMRPCEVIGLPWSSIDFSNNTISVEQDATEDREIGLLKSAAAYRTIHMPAVAMSSLKQWRGHCPASAYDLVFPNRRGGIESHANITNRCWYVLQRQCGFVNSRGKTLYALKSLRHVRASLEIHNGASAKEIQSLMGHSTVKITFDVYGHLFKDHDSERAERANLIANQISSCGEIVA